MGVIKESVAIANRARSKYLKATNSESSVVLPMIAGWWVLMGHVYMTVQNIVVHVWIM